MRISPRVVSKIRHARARPTAVRFNSSVIPAQAEIQSDREIYRRAVEDFGGSESLCGNSGFPRRSL
jgi:hypothetical protein